MSLPLTPSFNSIVVRLKAFLDQFDRSNVFPFQFHSGSIKRTTFRLVRLKQTRFNSIVVRLKVVLSAVPDYDHSGFNSIVVRLKEVGLTPPLIVDDGFNSIVVRLKAIRRGGIKG